MVRFRLVHYFLCFALLLVMAIGLGGTQAVFAQEKSPPVADFATDSTTGVVPLKVKFIDISMGTVTSWSWDFGDGGTGKEQNPSHEYTSVGTYTVSLTVTGPGGTNTKTREDYISVVKANIKLECKFPVLTGESGETYQTDVDIKYQGKERKRLAISFTTPKDWNAIAVSSYPERQVAAVELGPSEQYQASEKVTVKFAPAYWYLPDPGEYVVTMKVSSGDVQGSIELTGKVTAKYQLGLTTETGKLNVPDVAAGRDNNFTIKLINTGSAAIEDTTFTSSKPEAWTLKFEPEKIDSVEPGMSQDVNVVIKPPKGKTIAGDYSITITASSKKVTENIDLRVTVLTPQIWGWVGIIIVLVVIAGLAVLFRQLGRR